MTEFDKAAHDPARQPARLLRRRRPRHPDRRARASSATARRSMSATRSCTTAMWSSASRPWARCSSRSSTSARRPAGGVLRPRRAQGGAGRGRRGARCSIVDATCPLVSKVHREAERHHAAGRTVVLIGHAGHPEVIGTMGQLPAGAVLLIETWPRPRALERAPIRTTSPIVTQTTLSVDDTAEIVGGAAPPLPGDRRARTGRHLLRHHQPPGGGEGDRAALRRAGGDRRAQLLQLAAAGRGGAPTTAAARRACVQRAADIDWAWLDGVAPLGITAGASAPETAGRRADRGLPRRASTSPSRKCAPPRRASSSSCRARWWR